MADGTAGRFYLWGMAVKLTREQAIEKVEALIFEHEHHRQALFAIDQPAVARRQAAEKIVALFDSSPEGET